MKDAFSKFFQNLLLHGLEHFNKYYSTYRGSVIDNQDPKGLGRVRINCPTIYGTENPDIWVFPYGVISGNKSGVYWIPPIGAPIYITCENGDPRKPLWSYGWFLQNQTIDGAAPGVHIFQTPYGHRIEMNDNTKQIDILHPAGFHVKLYEDGIFIGNGDDNLGKRLDDLFELFAQTTVATPGGPSPFNNLVDYAALRTQLAAFLKKS